MKTFDALGVSLRSGSVHHTKEEADAAEHH